SELRPPLGNLPAAAPGAASGSINASQAVAARLGPAGGELARFADSSFVHAMHVTTLISAAITLLGALIVIRWVPGRAAARAAGPVPPGGPPPAGPPPPGPPARQPLPPRGAPPAGGAAVRGGASVDGRAAPEGGAWPNGAAAPDGGASRNGQGTADGVARPGGSAPMEG